jgi:multidrug efflux pump subunit AcrA (membrane-fusion protein)
LQVTGTVEGRVVAGRSRDVSAKVSNAIKRLYVIKGQNVRECDPLVEFATKLTQSQPDTARIQLRMTKKIILAAQTARAPFDGQITAPRYRENAYVDVSENAAIARLTQQGPILALARV